MSSTFTARWNDAALEDNYHRWRSDPSSVAADWAAFFEGFELGSARVDGDGTSSAGEGEPIGGDSTWQTRVDGLVYAYRTLGHCLANLDPLTEAPQKEPLLTLETLGFAEHDLDRTVSSKYFREGASMKLREMILALEGIYCSTIGVEFTHIQNPLVRNWVRDRMEQRVEEPIREPEVHRYLLKRLYEAETFEHFLHTRYTGQKRFSLEGGEALILALTAVLEDCEKHSVGEIVMGMAHRGRLNVLANFLDKPLDVIFNEFHGNFVLDVGGNGDVKYHLGYSTTRELPSGHKVEIRLAANPSHLEAVDPVVQGMARARQRISGDTEDRKKVLPLLVHGDAAFIAQGVVAEVFNMSQLPGYRTGGTVHIIVNNQIGFTTLPADARSTRYCTDIAKMIEAPIFHVNGDDPLAVVQVARMALEFRQQFGRDVVVDIYCYRRHGHNEGDEPSFTQPNLYSKIHEHPPLSETFLEELTALGSLDRDEAESIRNDALEELEAALRQVKSEEKSKSGKKSEFTGSTAIFQPPYSHEPADTAISDATLEKIVRALTTVPENFRVLPKIRRMLLDRRLRIWKAGGPFDWAYAESLAFGALLLEGTPVRLSGQDSRRGTFSQRHSVFYDEHTRERHIPLLNLGPDQASFCVYNSPLSEYAVLGFDYGYSMEFPSMLCIWEAQFGDFANGAQIVIDQFIASAESKWQRPSSIVMLLPHGYEGQGPEHSSARLERFLQLCAEENMQVCNPTTPAQYFHALRRQVHRGYRKPLVIMTPKSLLRSEAAVSKSEDFTNARFREILPGPEPGDAGKVRRVIFCSGKVYYDLLAHQTEHGLENSTVLIRLEQLYPLYREKLAATAEPYLKARRFVWCQEEPANMGAWTHLYPQFREIFNKNIHYAGRPASASPAPGSLKVHEHQQEELVKQAFSV